MLALYPWFVFFLTLATPMIWRFTPQNRGGGKQNPPGSPRAGTVP
jgi:hypothetical protein